jgi:tetratricopeptide (TPR) repeat protein
MNRARVIGIGAVVALGTGLAVSRVARPAVVSAAADTSITSRSIAFFEGRLALDSMNYMVGGQLIARYLMRFQTGADLADVDRAEAVAKQIMPLVSDTAGAFARLGLIYLTRHRFDEAYAVARRAVAWNSNNQSALGILFDAAMASGHYVLAESTLHRMTPNRVPYQLRLAHLLTSQGRMDGAYTAMGRACTQIERAQLQPQVVAWCLSEMAKVEHARRGPNAAMALFEQALEIQPGYRGAVEGLADLAYARGEWERAARYYRQIAADAHPDLYLRLAEAQRQLGDTAQAANLERDFLRVTLAPGAEPLYAHPLALYYAERPEMRDSAVAVARRDVARRPAVESWDVLSVALLRHGDLDSALAASDSARVWGAPSPSMDYHRARIFEALGRGMEAAPLLTRALTDPTLLEPNIQQVLRREGARW